MNPSETVRELSRSLTLAIWHEALAVKEYRTITAAACASHRQALADRIRFIADRWNSEDRRDACREGV